MKLPELWILSFLAITTKSIAQEIRVVCYVTNWSVYRPGIAKFSPQNVNPYLCTHLIYAFGKIEDDYTIEPLDEYQDITRKGYAQLNDLKTVNTNLKTLLSFGGWGKGSALFSPLAADVEQRVAFAKTAVGYLRRHDFDGLDLLWEYPATMTGSKPEDRENLVQFVKELREAFDRESTDSGRPRLLLSLGISGYLDRIVKGYDVSELNKFVDWFNLLSYDYHDSSVNETIHHAPLFPIQEGDMRNIDFCVEYLTGAGADLQKLVIGIPTYGRSYTLADANTNQIGASATGPGMPGNATREAGFLAYYEICENINFGEGWTVNQNDQVMGPYVYKDDQWVSYDDENIVRRKAQYVARNELGGVMFWSLDTDDFRGLCLGRPYPLVEAAKDALSTTQNQIFTTPVPPSTRTPGSTNCGYAGNVICPNSVPQIITTSSTPENVSDEEMSDHVRSNVLGRASTKAQELPTVASTIATQATSIIRKIPEKINTTLNTPATEPAVITTSPIRLYETKESALPSDESVDAALIRMLAKLLSTTTGGLDTMQQNLNVPNERAPELPMVALKFNTEATSIIPKIPEKPSTISNPPTTEPAVITTSPIRLHEKKESALHSDEYVDAALIRVLARLISNTGGLDNMRRNLNVPNDNIPMFYGRPDELSANRVVKSENTDNSNSDQNDANINIRINEPLTYRDRRPNSQIAKIGEGGNTDDFVAETQQFAPVQRPRNTLINIFVW